MPDKTYIPDDQDEPDSQIGATIEALSNTIASRAEADATGYTHRLLVGCVDDLLDKIGEEASEVVRAAHDVESCRCGDAADDVAGDVDGDAAGESALIDHLRYEVGDLIYHAMVVLERYGISSDEFAAELNNRMTDEERPLGAVLLYDRFVQRGK